MPWLRQLVTCDLDHHVARKFLNQEDALGALIA